jgi:hypothetical protein
MNPYDPPSSELAPRQDAPPKPQATAVRYCPLCNCRRSGPWCLMRVGGLRRWVCASHRRW